MKELCEAFEIFMKYNPGQWLEGADHDIIYGPAFGALEPSREDGQKLKDLGWFIQDDGWVKFV